MKVLVAVANEDLRTIIGEMLRGMGKEVVEVDDGVDAISKLLTEPLELAVIFENLESLSGDKVVIYSKWNEKTASVPLIYVKERNDAPADEVFSLPLDFDRLLETCLELSKNVGERELVRREERDIGKKVFIEVITALEWHLKFSMVIEEYLEKISAATSLSEIEELTVRALSKICGGAVHIFLYEERRAAFAGAKSSTVPDERIRIMSIALPDDVEQKLLEGSPMKVEEFARVVSPDLFLKVELVMEETEGWLFPVVVNERGVPRLRGLIFVEGAGVRELNMKYARVVVKNFSLAVAEEWYTESLENEVQKVQVLSAVAAAISSLEDVDKALQRVAVEIARSLDAERVSIMLLEGRTKLKLRAGVGIRKDLIGKVVLKKGKGIAGWVAYTGKPVLIRDITENPFFRREARKGYRSKSFVIVPVKSKGKVIGVINAADKREGDFTEKDRELLEAVANQVAVAVENGFLYQSIEKGYIEAVKTLINALEAKDRYTQGHSERVAYFSKKIAERMGLDRKKVEEIELAGVLHDIGKLGVPDAILQKQSKLTDEEYQMIKQHPVKGELILKSVKRLRSILTVVRHHHERVDGKGYPDRLKGDEIPLPARIVAVADAFDAMISDRPYRKGLPVEEAIRRLEDGKGSQFDPEVVDTFVEWLREQMKRKGADLKSALVG